VLTYLYTLRRLALKLTYGHPTTFAIFVENTQFLTNYLQKFLALF